jgi:hypothetical protein
MDMYMEIQRGHRREATIDTNVQHGHRHETWTLTCTVNMEMHHGHGRACFLFSGVPRRTTFEFEYLLEFETEAEKFRI